MVLELVSLKCVYLGNPEHKHRLGSAQLSRVNALATAKVQEILEKKKEIEKVSMNFWCDGRPTRVLVYARPTLTSIRA